MTYQPSKVGFVQFTHRDERGSVDYWGILTVEFGEDGGQWVGICRESVLQCKPIRWMKSSSLCERP